VTEALVLGCHEIVHIVITKFPDHPTLGKRPLCKGAGSWRVIEDVECIICGDAWTALRIHAVFPGRAFMVDHGVFIVWINRKLGFYVLFADQVHVCVVNRVQLTLAFIASEFILDFAGTLSEQAMHGNLFIRISRALSYCLKPQSFLGLLGVVHRKTSGVIIVSDYLDAANDWLSS